MALPKVRGIFSHVREYPPWTPKRTQGALPLDPAIAGLQLKGCTRCAVWVRCTWLRHESLRVVTICNRALLS